MRHPILSLSLHTLGFQVVYTFKGFRFRHTWAYLKTCKPANAKAQPIAPPTTEPKFS